MKNYVVSAVSKNTKGSVSKKIIPHKVTDLVIFLYLCQKKFGMRVLAKKILRKFWEKHSDSEHQLKTWYKEASKATWTTPSEIKSEYPKASILKASRVVFNIYGNKYRLVVEINYDRQWVFIRFIGNHTDYDKIDANKI